MRKLFLLFALMFSSFIQSQSFDDLLKKQFEDFKKQKLEYEEQRPILVDALNNIAKSAKDTVFKREVKQYAEQVKTQKLSPIESKNIYLSKLPESTRANFELKEDKFSGFTFLTHTKIKSYCYLYIGERAGNPYLRFVNRFDGQDWAFMKKITFLIDGNKFVYYPENIKREVYMGGLYERSDDVVTQESTFDLLNALANAKDDIQIRYEGDRTFDRKYNTKMSKSIKETLDLYQSFNIKH